MTLMLMERIESLTREPSELTERLSKVLCNMTISVLQVSRWPDEGFLI